MIVLSGRQTASPDEHEVLTYLQACVIMWMWSCLAISINVVHHLLRLGKRSQMTF